MGTFNVESFKKIFQQLAGDDAQQHENAGRMLARALKGGGVHPVEIEFTHAGASSSSRETDKLQRALTEALNSLNQANYKVARLERQEESLKKELKSSIAKAAAQTRKFNEQLTRNAELESESEDLALENAKLKDEIARLKATSRAQDQIELTDQLLNIVKQYTDLRDQAAAAQHATPEHEETIAQQAAKIATLQLDLDEALRLKGLSDRHFNNAAKTQAYLRRYVSDRVWDLCQQNGMKYSDEDELIGEPSWARR